MEQTIDPASTTVLVIDDNEANRLLAQGTLEDEGYRVALAAGGAEGLAAFSRGGVDCVLLDVRMPAMDGFEVCRRLRGLPGGAEASIIFLTAQRDIDTFELALSAGGDDFLTKPVRPAELLVRVQTALKLKQTKDLLREHYDLLRRQRDDLMRVQLQRERLMAFVVHDLKNPVNSLDLHAQLLLRDRALSGQSREWVSQMRTEARLLNRMILNLLDLSKADEGKLTPRRSAVRLPDLIQSVFSELEVLGHHRGIRLQTSLAVETAQADEDLLRRMVANLVENAIRHAPPQSAVTVASAAADGAVELRVADEGGGVPAEMRARIFDPFVQLQGEGRVAAREGRGLGLSFCRMVAETHGGRIWVEDGAPGAIFCARIPDES